MSVGKAPYTLYFWYVEYLLGHEGVKSLVNASFVFLFQQEFY